VAHDVFICHSSEDKTLANAACAKLEAAGIRCWIAPRDPLPGIPYGRQLVSAIETSGIILLIFSGHANRSEHILRELELASDRGKIVVPYRIEDVKPTGDLEYYIRNVHWLDAMTEPVETRLDELVGLVGKVLATVPGHTTPSAPAPLPAAAPVAARERKPAAGRGGLIAGVIGLVAALAFGAYAYVSGSHKNASAPVAPPTTAAVAAQATAKPAPAAPSAAAKPPAAAPAPAAAPTARIVYVEKPAAPAPAAKPSVHIVETAKPVATAPPATIAATPAAAAPAAVAVAPAAAPAAAQSSDFDSDLRRLLSAASTHFADVKGTPRTIRGEQQYAYTAGVAGLDFCFIHQNAAGVLASTSCRIYNGPDPDVAQTAYKKYAGLIGAFASASGGTARERPRPAGGGFVTGYTTGAGRVRVVLFTNDGQSNVSLWGDAPP